MASAPTLGVGPRYTFMQHESVKEFMCCMYLETRYGFSGLLVKLFPVAMQLLLEVSEINPHPCIIFPHANNDQHKLLTSLTVHSASYSQYRVPCLQDGEPPGLLELRGA